jgi:tryptophan synthase beta chain
MADALPESLDMYDLPDSRGHFGPYGGTFVSETLVHALDELRDAYARYQKDPISTPSIAAN